ncbi:MAG: hypothetical protein MJ178_00885 [Treponemataceae bacterium]|nr:hypothetical protein [Treponemataceae bacterium]
MTVVIPAIRKISLAILLCIAGTAVLRAEGLILDAGLYDNTHQLILVSESQPSSKVYKTFNTYWYDGPHAFDDAAVAASPVAQIGDGLYVDFCIRYHAGPQSDGIAGIWLPGGNSRDLSVNGGQEATAKKERLTGYYISDDGDVWAIPYWKVDAVFDAAEIAFLTLDDESDSVQIAVQKKVSVGGITYTCTVGRSTRIRNPEKLDAVMLSDAKLSADGQVLSFSEPLFTRSPVAPEDLDALITQKNTTVYPPRFLWIQPQEPAIYRVLEAMPPHLD